MRKRFAAVGVLVALALPFAGHVLAAPPPALQAKRAQAQAVLAQVNALDVTFGKIVDSWDGARLQLAATERQLAANRVELARARRDSWLADRRVAQRLVTIYESDRPDLVQVLSGVARLSDLIDVVEVSHDVAASDQRVAAQARQAKRRLSSAQHALRRAERQRQTTLAALAAERSRISSMLARRRRLLASVQSEIAAMQAREAARQRLLAAEARARLAREQAALRAQAAARAAAAAHALHAAPPAAASTTAASTTAAPTTAPADPAAASTTTTAPAIAPAGGGHPEAASIALQYLGIAYQWGGASPDSGFDCFGLVMYVYAQLGIQLPHYAAAQFGFGEPVSRDQLQPGDLVFFDGLSHVGIYIGNGEIVHAPHAGDVVKISPLSEFSAGYVGARRL